MTIRRIALLGVGAIVAIGIAAPYVDAEGYRTRIQDALERALHRKVTVEKVRFNLFTGPGFTVEGVTIAEDPSVGIEPFAYVDELEARVRLTSLWARRISLSNLRLKGIPTLNIVKTEGGVWNYQLLLNHSAADPRDFPSIEVRGGRINFKFGDNKSVFYVSDADIDVDAIDHNRVQLWFSGQPARTDRAARYFGRFLAKGVWTRAGAADARLDITAELESTAISEVARLFDSSSAVHGMVASRARIRGPISNLAVTGELRLEDIHRWDMMPQKGGAWSFQYRGAWDMASHHLELATLPAADTPLIARFRATDYMYDPHWAASIELRDAPASPFVGVARHMGAPLPDGITLDGKVSGVVGYSKPGGAQGRFSIVDSAVQLPGATPVRVRSANVLIEGSRTAIGPAVIEMNDSQTAELTGSYDASERALQLRIGTEGMNVAELHSGSGRLLGAGFVPVLEKCRQGVWRGWVRYTAEGDKPGAWSGDFSIQNARIVVPGLAEPARITSGTVVLDATGRLALSHMKAHLGDVQFRGEYRYIPGANRPERIKIDVPEMDMAQVEQLLLPTLVRHRGLLARFRFRTPAGPDWLKTRKLEGDIKVEKLTAGGEGWTVHSRLVWDGFTARLTDLEAHQEYGQASGELNVDLSGSTPRYHFAGRITDLNYKGGALALEGSFDTRGSGVGLLANAHGAATFAGEDIVFSPDAEFRSITGALELQPEAHLRLMSVQAAHGFDVYSGQGAAQGDGRVVLDLTTGRKQLRVAGNLFPAPEPN